MGAIGLAADNAFSAGNAEGWTEAQRLAALDRYHILDTPPEPDYDNVIKLVCQSLDVPIAAVNFIAEHRQWFKAEIGLGVSEMELDNSICAKAILQSDMFIVPDTTKDSRFDCNELVTGPPGLRFYAGALLKTSEGFPIGTLCALDVKPRPEGLTDHQELLLATLANLLMDALELRRTVKSQSSALDSEIADRLQMEEALRQSQKMEAIGQLTGGVAHDFNNLLTVIRGSVDLLRRDNLPEDKRRRYLDAVADTADRAASLTAQLLAYARRQPLKPEIFDAAERVRGITQMLTTMVGSRVRIQADLDCDPCPVEADPNQFETALLNLAVNARDAMPEGGVLRIGIEHVGHVPAVRAHPARSGGFVAISVTDTGSGIGASDITRVFEPFYTTKEIGKGTGLGLSQVLGFAKQSDGEIAVESETGAGAKFTLYLPHHARDGRPPVAEIHAADWPDMAGKPGRVLIVEDNRAVGEFALESLSERGYQATLAGDAAAALASLEKDPTGFDIVFSDVVMPGQNGIELAKTIAERWPSLPVVLTSGYSHILAEEGSQGFELVQKPYLIETVDQTLRRKMNKGI